MAKPRWLAQSLAILSVILYSVDIGSDSWVGVDLIRRCHYKFAASVFSWLLIPGLIWGWVDFFQEGECTTGAFFKALFFPILMVPFTFWKLIKAAWDIDSKSDLEDAKL